MGSILCGFNPTVTNYFISYFNTNQFRVFVLVHFVLFKNLFVGGPFWLKDRIETFKHCPYNLNVLLYHLKKIASLA